MAMDFKNKVRCNNCMEEFYENEIVYDGGEDMEFCPYCGEGGCIMDLEDDHIKKSDSIEGIKHMSLREFLRTKTNARELCIIREDGWTAATCLTDYEYLFQIPPKLVCRPVKSDEWGFLTTSTESGDTVKIQCHYIDV